MTEEETDELDSLISDYAIFRNKENFAMERSIARVIVGKTLDLITAVRERDEKIARYEEALKIFADETNWDSVEYYDFYCPYCFSYNKKDPQKLAKDALEETEEEK